MFLKRARWSSSLLLFLLALACWGCEKETDVDSGATCLDDKTHFQRDVWSAFMGQQCYACHNSGGQASDSQFVLQSDSQAGFIERNLAVLRDVASYQKDGTSILLLKPTGDIDHGGGTLIDKSSGEYEALVALVERFDSPVQCGENQAEDIYLDGVVQTSLEETLRKASLTLVGRLPTARENFEISVGGEEALPGLLDAMMTEEAFFARIEEMFNDLFLVERYVESDDAIDLLSDTDAFPNARWYFEDDDDPPDFSAIDPAFLEAARQRSNEAVAREPLYLASYLVRNDRPFTEILTADFMIVNPFSAAIYGIDLTFDDPLDYHEFREGRIPNGRHAGILTSPMWLNRFPTTDTNRNRHRARMVYSFFLATDIMQLAERPIDPTSIQDHNPTVNSATCNACHRIMDPLAGSLQNWGETGSYSPREDGWYAEMWAPGFEDEKMPFDQTGDAVRWVVPRIASDPRFATSMVHHVFRTVTGRDPLRFPGPDTDGDVERKTEEFEAQERLFSRVTAQFVEGNYNLKIIFRELVTSPYFRATNFTGSIASESEEGPSALGVGRLLTPELLSQKIRAVTGQSWVDGNGNELLLNEDEYMLLYGGIDSDDVVLRMKEPNGLMVGIQFRMAAEMACRTTALDFAALPDERRYFPYVSLDEAPQDEADQALPDAVEAIRKNIQYLHWHILGQRLDEDDDEIERTFGLFVQTWREGRVKLQLDTLQDDLDCKATHDAAGIELPEDRRVIKDPDYLVRAWSAVITYLLADYRFLYD
jgi:hypothetical protein